MAKAQFDPISVFPPLYEHWLAGRYPQKVTETLATCQNCAMQKPEGITRDPGPFKADLKCCTYFPFVPNFGLGSMLKNAELQQTSRSLQMRWAAASQQGLFLPTGLHASPERQQLSFDLGPSSFGQRSELLCPFFDTNVNACSVWSDRPGVCATYFCKSDRGQEGLTQWKQIEEELNTFEWKLANQVLAALGITADHIELCKAALSIEESGEERDYFLKGAWGDWYLRQSEFYKACLDHAIKIGPQEIQLNGLS